MLGQKHAAEIVKGDPGLQNSVEQQYVLSLQVDRGNIRDFSHANRTRSAVACARADHRTAGRYLQGPDQVGHKHQAIIQYSYNVKGLALIIPIDLPGQLAHALAYFPFREGNL